MGKSSGSSDPSDNKHEQKLQAVLLADTFSNSFHPITLEDYTGNLPSSSPATTDGNNVKGRERPLALCPLNNVPLLHHTIDFLQSAGVEELFLLCSNGADALEQFLHQHKQQQQQQHKSSGANNRITWSSKLTIHLMRFTDCTNTGDALRELDRKNVIKSDPFILMQGDVVTNADLREVMEQHAVRKKADNSAIMTVLLQEVGGWGLDDDDDEDKEEEANNNNAMMMDSDNPNAPNDHPRSIKNKNKMQKNHYLPPLRSSTDDLLLAMDTTHSNRILLWDSRPHNSTASIPTIFFAENSSNITITRNHLDVGIDICSPDVLARFSDEFDYRELRSQFVANCVAEEEIGLQSRIFGYTLKRGEYAGRMGDMRRYHRVSMDLLRRWGYPLVPDNYNHLCSGGSYHEASYVCERHLVYRDVSGGGHGDTDGKERKRSHVGRSTQLSGPLLLGPNASIGEFCHLQRSVLGPNCTLMDNCYVVDSHLWGDVLVEEGAKLNGVIVCEGAIIRKGAVVDRGCVIGRGCIVGAGVHLKEFTRITLAEEVEDDDDYSGFDDSSSEDSSSSSSDSGSESGTDDEESSSDESEKASAAQVSNVPSATSEVKSESAVDTNYEVVGKDGLGRVWVPSVSDEYDSDDDEEEDKQAEAIELMKSESIGYDMTLLYKRWKKLQMEEEDDGFSLDEMDSDDDDMDMDDQWADDIGDTSADINTFSNLDEDGMQITGRQKGVDVVQELRDICLEHETSSPVENLRIELNSFKFSQNATYSDCCKGAMMAVMEKVFEEYPDSIPTPGKLVVSLKKTLEYWQQLFHSICMGSEEEKAIIHALETMALGSGKTADVLAKEPAFRFVLQTLHDKEIVNEQAIFEWAEERKEEGRDGSKSALFWQQPTQDFLEWLEESSDEDSSDGSDDEDSD